MKRFLSSILIMFCALAAVGETLRIQVTAYDQVTLSGDGADRVTATYIQRQETKYKCRLLAGDTALLTLSGLPSGHLESITLQMRSNASSGAGSLRLRVGEKVVWSIADAPFSDAAWYGSWSSDYVAIQHAISCSSGDLSLEIAASANSIYLQQVALTYSPTPDSAHTVHFRTQTAELLLDEREQTPGGGVFLPSLRDPSAAWSFVGWTEILQPETTDVPVYFPAGTTYHPAADVTLFALYSYHLALNRVPQDTLLLSGEYVLAQGSGFNLMATGSVTNKKIAMESCTIVETEGNAIMWTSYIPTSARYQLDFLPETDSVWIRSLEDGSPVGYKYGGSSASRYLTASAVGWRWMWGKNHSIAFYHHPLSDGYARILMPFRSLDDDSFSLQDQRLGLTEKESYLLLFEVSNLPDEPEESRYSGYPILSALAEHEIVSEPDWTQHLTVWTPDGRLLWNGICCPADLPHGLLFIRQGERTWKIAK